MAIIWPYFDIMAIYSQWSAVARILLAASQDHRAGGIAASQNIKGAFLLCYIFNICWQLYHFYTTSQTGPPTNKLSVFVYGYSVGTWAKNDMEYASIFVLKLLPKWIMQRPGPRYLKMSQHAKHNLSQDGYVVARLVELEPTSTAHWGNMTLTTRRRPSSVGPWCWTRHRCPMVAR